jgi:hypothetical protein
MTSDKKPRKSDPGVDELSSHTIYDTGDLEKMESAAPKGRLSSKAGTDKPIGTQHSLTELHSVSDRRVAYCHTPLAVRRGDTFICEKKTQ